MPSKAHPKKFTEVDLARLAQRFEQKGEPREYRRPWYADYDPEDPEDPEVPIIF